MSIARICRSTPRPPLSRPRSKDCSRRASCVGATRRRSRTGISWPGPTSPRRCPAKSISGRSSSGFATGCHPMRSSATAPGISPSGFIAIIVIGAMARSFADLGLHGLRRAGGDRDEAPGAGPHGRCLRRRRRLPDDRAGVRHRRAIRAADDSRGRGQRHVRNDPHAPGAPLPRPRRGDRPEESRFRRLCTGIRRPWRYRRAHHRFPACIRGGAGSGLPAIIHLKVDPEALTPGMSLSAIRASARSRA